MFSISSPSCLGSSALATVATSIPPPLHDLPRSSCQTNSFPSAGPVPQGPLGSAQWPGKCSDWLGCGPDQMFRTSNLTLLCHTLLCSPAFFFFLKTNKNQQPKCAWSPVPLSLCRSLHIPSSGSCARARSNPVLLPPSLYLRFTGLILSRGATCVIKNDCYAK